MNIIVCAKQVIDVSEMKVDPSTKKPILQGVPQKISDIDKNAIEEAIININCTPPYDPMPTIANVATNIAISVQLNPNRLIILLSRASICSN